MMNIARLLGRHSGRRRRRARLSGGARLCPRAPAGQGARRDGPGPSRIVEHPDVQMMLLRMAALVAASRALCYACAHAIDMSRRAPARRPGGSGRDRASLLTPVAKAFRTDAAIEVANLGIQVHGGAGYIEETGAAQHLRDARVFADLRGHQRHPGDRPRPAQAPMRDGAVVTAFTAELQGDRRCSRGCRTAPNSRPWPSRSRLRSAT